MYNKTINITLKNSLEHTVRIIETVANKRSTYQLYYDMWFYHQKFHDSGLDSIVERTTTESQSFTSLRSAIVFAQHVLDTDERFYTEIYGTIDYDELPF